ncbi:hypothetical protein PR048_027573 [Dryococelus australis]|uniref:Uncharacterized protein n=1 Tax=Dryococelus australis TaxID=614101 RepID=A0ABQ9GGX4_9NEOP|nr:hypothetical protein PR048_027573 [Dryococelus australis]
MDKVMRHLPILTLHKAEEHTTCIQVDLNQGFQKGSFDLEPPRKTERTRYLCMLFFHRSHRNVYLRPDAALHEAEEYPERPVPLGISLSKVIILGYATDWSSIRRQPCREMSFPVRRVNHGTGQMGGRGLRPSSRVVDWLVVAPAHVVLSVVNQSPPGAKHISLFTSKMPVATRELSDRKPSAGVAEQRQARPYHRGAAVAERLACSPPTKAKWVQSRAGSPDFRMWESCRTMPLVGGFSRGSPVSTTLSFRCCSILTSITYPSLPDPATSPINHTDQQADWLDQPTGHADQTPQQYWPSEHEATFISSHVAKQRENYKTFLKNLRERRKFKSAQILGGAFAVKHFLFFFMAFAQRNFVSETCPSYEYLFPELQNKKKKKKKKKCVSWELEEFIHTCPLKRHQYFLLPTEDGRVSGIDGFPASHALSAFTGKEAVQGGEGCSKLLAKFPLPARESSTEGAYYFQMTLNYGHKRCEVVPYAKWDGKHYTTITCEGVVFKGVPTECARKHPNGRKIYLSKIVVLKMYYSRISACLKAPSFVCDILRNTETDLYIVSRLSARCLVAPWFVCDILRNTETDLYIASRLSARCLKAPWFVCDILRNTETDLYIASRLSAGVRYRSVGMLGQWGNGRSRRKPADKRRRQERFPRAKIRVQPTREPNPVRLDVRRVVYPLHHRGPVSDENTKWLGGFLDVGYPFSDLLREALGTALVSDWLMHAAKCSLLAGLSVGEVIERTDKNFPAKFPQHFDKFKLLYVVDHCCASPQFHCLHTRKRSCSLQHIAAVIISQGWQAALENLGRRDHEEPARLLERRRLAAILLPRERRDASEEDHQVVVPASTPSTATVEEVSPYDANTTTKG